jgi:hypothetical protein
MTGWNYRLSWTTPREKALFVGGVFLPSKRYKVNLSNDRMTTPRVLEAKFKDYGNLTVQFPTDMPDDHYLFNIYEEHDLIGNILGTVSADSAKKSFCNIWTTFYECPTIDILYQTGAGPAIERSDFLCHAVSRHSGMALRGRSRQIETPTRSRTEIGRPGDRHETGSTCRLVLWRRNGLCLLRGYKMPVKLRQVNMKRALY